MSFKRKILYITSILALLLIVSYNYVGKKIYGVSDYWQGGGILNRLRSGYHVFDCTVGWRFPFIWLAITLLVLLIPIFLITRSNKKKDCQNCGYGLENNWEFCPECGAQL